MPLPKARNIGRYVTLPPVKSASRPAAWSVEPSPAFLMETLSRHSELKSVGTARFSGSMSHVNRLWTQYRNFVRQAMSNFEVAMGVGNRSSSLLYYYAMLNFAKAELLNQHHALIVDQKILHGLSFNPIRAKTVAGDSLTVTSGVFPMLYQQRTGYQLPIGTLLPVKRLLSAIPEIATQLDESGVATGHVATMDVALAFDSTECWVVLRVDPRFMDEPSLTRKHILQHFREVQRPGNWRDIFAISKRLPRDSRMLQSRRTTPYNSSTYDDVLAIMDDISDVFVVPGYGAADAFITPYLYKTRKVVMPPSLARYAVTYYASSLVRYRPTAFDADKLPEQAYLFDAIARECALPMLVDTLTHLEGRPQLFFPEGSQRV